MNLKAKIESQNQRQKNLKAKLNADRKVSKVRRLLKVRKREVKCRAVIEEEGKAETFIALAKGKCQAGSVTRRDLPCHLSATRECKPSSPRVYNWGPR